MTEITEIEKRYQVSGKDLTPLLRQCTFKHEKRVVDVYYDTPEGDHYRNGVFIRIRNGKILDVKFNPDHVQGGQGTDHVSCAEYSFTEPFSEADAQKFQALDNLVKLSQPGGTTFDAFFQHNRLEAFLTIDKIRNTYTQEGLTVVVDEIQDFGTFLEVEIEAAEGDAVDMQEAIGRIDAFAAPLKANALRSGVFELILREKDYDLYKQGRYLLEEDQAA